LATLSVVRIASAAPSSPRGESASTARGIPARRRQEPPDHSGRGDLDLPRPGADPARDQLGHLARVAQPSRAVGDVGDAAVHDHAARAAAAQVRARHHHGRAREAAGGEHRGGHGRPVGDDQR